MPENNLVAHKRPTYCPFLLKSLLESQLSICRLVLRLSMFKVKIATNGSYISPSLESPYLITPASRSNNDSSQRADDDRQNLSSFSLPKLQPGTCVSNYPTSPKFPGKAHSFTSFSASPFSPASGPTGFFLIFLHSTANDPRIVNDAIAVATTNVLVNALL